ncbi:hypothetical protein OCS_03771 [Ophiocordyceps sinensis CO18]|uniref:Uncharacterized protein n=1 Tax=Ophiocordyceps sinensis (strain Co18 / CGMCC 3.14243) TaxID=911162 RepID=T5AD44_OPHSC|nr:hypothetical protein OCS_03771 [Ophiocordyceps sinensis CO18]
MKYTTLLAYIAALESAALALPQAPAGPAAPATVAGESAATPPSPKTAGAAGREATGTGSKASGGEPGKASGEVPGLEIDADFGPSSSDSPGKISVERAKNGNKSAVAITAQSSGPFTLHVEFKPEEAKETIAEGAKSVGVPQEAIKSIVQPFEQIASSNATSHATSNDTTNGTSVDSKVAVKAVAAVAVACAKAPSDAPPAITVQGCIQVAVNKMYGDTGASRGLTNVMVGAATAGEELQSVIKCAFDPQSLWA